MSDICISSLYSKKIYNLLTYIFYMKWITVKYRYISSIYRQLYSICLNFSFIYCHIPSNILYIFPDIVVYLLYIAICPLCIGIYLLNIVKCISSIFLCHMYLMYGNISSYFFHTSWYSFMFFQILSIYRHISSLYRHTRIKHRKGHTPLNE